MSADRTLLVCLDRQRTRRVDRDRLVTLCHSVLGRMKRSAEMAVHLVGPREMAGLNTHYLGHEGSTDVITFDHGSGDGHLHGEVYICIADAVAQAAAFGTTWTEELARYVVHGMLHLDGYDDLEPAPRRVMKRRENALVAWLRGSGRLGALERTAARRRRHG